MAQFIIIKNSLGEGLIKLRKTYLRKSPDELAKVGLQMINWIVNGSSANSAVPPIKDGILRGSGSVFVGKKFIGATPDPSGNGTPNRSYSGNRNEVTLGFNTAYAAKMHENLPPAGKYNLGATSLQSGDVQGKFIESHLASDGKAAMRFYAKLLGRAIV